MNKEWKVLRSKALELVDKDLETTERDHVVMYSEHLKMVNAKFAELIIHKCIDAVISVPLPNEYEQRCAESIRKYFGIKY